MGCGTVILLYMRVFRDKRVDVLVVLLILFIGFSLVWVLQGTYFSKPLIAWALFIVLPIVIYLSLRKSKPFRFIAMGTFLFGVVFALVLETMAELNGAWHVVDTVFTYRFPGGASLDAILGYLFMTLLTLVIYEHFIDSPHIGKMKLSSRRVAVALLPSACIVILLFIFSTYAPNLISVNHLYLKAGIAAILPAIIIGFQNPKIYTKMAQIMPLFFLIYLAFEFLAVKFSWWTYPSGQYIGTVSLFGVSFPFEELFFWMLFYAGSLVVYYEKWIDDGK